MALLGLADSRRSSSYRSSHWAPLRSWNLFSGRVGSHARKEQPPIQPQRSRSLRNYGGEGSRVGSATSTSSAHVRSQEQARKGGDNLRRGRYPRGSQGERAPMVIDMPVTIPSEEAMAGSRRRGHHARVSDISDDPSLIANGWPGGTIARYQQHHAHQPHRDHHYHHHHHYHHNHHHHHHHLYHQSPGHEQQRPNVKIVTSVGTDPTTQSAWRDTDQHRHVVNERASVPSNSHAPINAHNVAIEARYRLAERLRGATILRNRFMHNDWHSRGGLPRRFLQEFSLLMQQEEDGWSDDNMWELGVRDWLVAWGHGSGLQSSNMLSSSERFLVSQGLSKSAIKSLHREIFVSKLRPWDKELIGASLEHHDCSVCLEHFLPGQMLIRLPCKHKFHPDCLTPWLENHSQCPLCRAKVLVDVAGGTISGGGDTARAREDDLTAWVETLESRMLRLSIW